LDKAIDLGAIELAERLGAKYRGIARVFADAPEGDAGQRTVS
jgi:hypothetical protein